MGFRKYLPDRQDAAGGVIARGHKKPSNLRAGQARGCGVCQTPSRVTGSRGPGRMPAAAARIRGARNDKLHVFDFCSRLSKPGLKKLTVGPVQGGKLREAW